MSRMIARSIPAALVLASLAIAAATAFAQTTYTQPKGYGGAPAPVAPAAPPLAPKGQTNAVGSPTGRPAPAAPMPSPIPGGFDKVQSAIDQSVPFTPTEIMQLKRELYERGMAAYQNETNSPPAKPITSVETLDLSPNATPPVIRVTVGQGAVLSFNDAAGRPWPIADNLNFNGRAYEAKLIGPHLYSIRLLSREPASLTVVLKDLSRPIVITVLPATDETDYLKEYTVPRFLDGMPPAAVASSSREGALSFNSPELINYLYRTPPKGAKSLTAAGLPGVMVWQIAGNKMVVRTSGQVVIPAFSRRHASSDGVAVYEVPLSPVVSITEGGALHRVSIGGYTVETGATSSTK